MAIKYLKGKLVIGVVALVVVAWAVYGMIWAVYWVGTADNPTAPLTGLTLIIFALITTTVWFGLVALVLVIAWKRYGGPQPPPKQT